jgi:hypothetical protein
MKRNITVRRLVPALTEDEAIDLTNRPTLLTRSDVDHIVTTSEIGLKPDDEPLYVFLKNVIPYEFCVAAYPVALSAASAPVIGGTRAIAAGAYMQPRVRKDGTQGKRHEVPDLPHLKGAKNGVIGFFDRPQCRQTAYTAQHWERFLETLPLIRAVDSVFQEYLPERYATQAEAARCIDKAFLIDGKPYTTVTINRNWQTAVHLDEGDFKSGFGALTMLTAGDFSGGELVFPQYRVAVNYRMQDVLLADVHEPHGNLPILGTTGEYERVSLVLYFREGMLRACPAKPDIESTPPAKPGA